MRAKRDQVPAFRVMTDAVLHKIAALRPDGPAALRSVSGVNDRFVSRYGLELVALFDEGASAADFGPETA
jgi:superfamily II DNA helicase RecQ